MTQLHNSPLHEAHVALNASFTAFGPWNMPLKYGNELEEHRAVRNAAGLFDLSHMGEIYVSGAEAGKFLDYALVSHLSIVAIGKAKYSMIVDPSGGILDDLIVYRLAEEEYLVVPNAGNAKLVATQLSERAAGFAVTVDDRSADTALIAVQGPQAEALMSSLAQQPAIVQSLGYYAAVPATIAGHEVLLARTGYTGEDGFEIFLAPAAALALWAALLEHGEPFGLKPAGLAARDSLRLEAGMPLYGHELHQGLNPYAAGLGVVVGKNKPAEFVAKQALLEAPQSQRVLVGLVSSGRRAAREHAQLYSGDQCVGEVTSGQPSPTLGHPIALAYVDRAFAEVGTALEADIRGKRYPFEVVKLPFYSRKR